MLEPSTPRPHRRSRRRALMILGVLGVVMLLVIAGGGGYYLWATGASGDQSPLQVEIPQGSSTAAIADLLESKEVIRSALMFRVMSRFRGLGGSFEAGLYELSTNMPLNAVFDALKAGPVPPPTVKFAVPEGLRLSDIAKLAAEQLGLTQKGFLKASRSGEFQLDPYLPAGTTNLEGFLFPKVYEFFPDPTAKTVIERMLGQFEREVADLPWANAGTLGLTHYEAVIVASLVEEEGKNAEDRGKMARVIYNRLAAGMPLELDATIQYALSVSGETTQEDREVDSPYNTFLHTGLTPTPIAVSGIDSLRAALEPTPGDWYYFLSDLETGETEFFETYDEFLDALNSR